MTKEDFTTKSTEKKEDKMSQELFSDLWRDKDVVTFSFRRHGKWSPTETRVPLASLTPDGIRDTKAVAANWVDDVANFVGVDRQKIGELEGHGLTIKISESPSYIPGKVRRSRPDSKTVFPMRASQTASIYQNEIYGRGKFINQGTIDRDGTEKGPCTVPVSRERSRVALLGDFMENPDLDVSKLGLWAETKKVSYGDDSVTFWQDFVHNNLKPELEKARKELHAFNSIDLAKNLAHFLMLNSVKDTTDKLVNLDITHGETQDSFLYHLTRFLEQQPGQKPEIIEGDFGYNEGLDVHVRGDEIFVVRDGKYVACNLRGFIKYLNRLESK